VRVAWVLVQFSRLTTRIFCPRKKGRTRGKERDRTRAVVRVCTQERESEAGNNVCVHAFVRGIS
jgi:hypothetical protein